MNTKITLSAVIWLFAIPIQAAIDYIQAFENLANDVVWPTPLSNASNVSSTFGPRIRSSCNCPDFHRGIDIHGVIGDPVLATYPGKVVQVTTYPSGGKTVVIEHEFANWVTLVPGHGNTKRWYTFYMHLNEWYVAERDVIAAGHVIGELGNSVGDGSTTVSPHLHHEVRVGTRCSLEYAIENPSTTCNTKGYDPHVSPFLVYPNIGQTDITVTIGQTMDGLVDGIVHLETPDDIPNANKYVVEVVDRVNDVVVQSHTLDLNLRIGYDATSTEALDSFDETLPYLNPVSFGYSSTVWEIDLVVPASWIPSKSANEVVVITVTDVWGIDEPELVLVNGSITW